MNASYSSSVGSRPVMSIVDAAEELLVGAQAAGHDAQLVAAWRRRARRRSCRRSAGGVNCRSLGSTSTWLPTVNVSKRAMTNASPRSPAVTRPSGVIGAELSLFVRNTARLVTSRSVPSEYLARTMICCVAPSPSSTALGRIELDADDRRRRRPASFGRAGFEPAHERLRSTRCPRRTACRRCAAPRRSPSRAAGSPAATARLMRRPPISRVRR